MALQHFHFIGICGTAMGAVAAAMKQRGHVVTGSDAKVYPPMSDFLCNQGINIAEGYNENNIPTDADVVVIGNAISRGNPEAEAEPVSVPAMPLWAIAVCWSLVVGIWKLRTLRRRYG